jgi:phage gp29-like protein
MSVNETRREMLDNVGEGVTIGELEWANGRDRVYVKKVHFRQQQLFSFSAQPFGNFAGYASPQTGPLRLRPGLESLLQELNLDPTKSLEEQMPYKWMANSFWPKWGNRWGRPMKRRCFWWTWFKKGGLRAWLRMLEKGPGTIVTKYPGGASKDEQAKALEAGQAMMEEAQVAIPDKFTYELLQNVRASMGSMHNDLVDGIANNAITRILKGQTLTSRGNEGGTGSNALGEVHERVDQKKTEVDAKCEMNAWNARGGIIEGLVVYKFGPQDAYPKFTVHYEPGADKKLASDVIERATSWGLPVSKKQVREDLELREPESEEDTLMLPPKSQGQANVDKAGESAAFAEFAEESRELIGLLKAVKKKSRLSSSSTHLKPPTSKRERFSKLRPSMIESSKD